MPAGVHTFNNAFEITGRVNTATRRECNLGFLQELEKLISRSCLVCSFGEIQCVIAGPIDFRAPLAAVSLRPGVDGGSASLALLAC